MKNQKITTVKALSNISKKLSASLCAILLAIFTMLCSATANAQTVQPQFPNLSNVKGDSYTYEKIRGKGASYEEAEKVIVMKIRRLQAKRLSLPVDSVSVEKLTPATEILKNNVYEVFRIVENKDANANGVASQTTRITKVYLVPKKNFAKQ